eukprot:174583_1
MDYNTKLTVANVWGCQNAPKILGQLNIQRGMKLAPVAFFPSRLPCSFYVIIPKGFVGLVNRNGRYVGIWQAGYHVAPPWVTVSHLIPQQYTVYDIPVKECPTQDNVMVTIDVTIIFRIMTEDETAVYNFCYRLGPDKLDKMLRAFQEEEIRGMVRKRKYNEIYDLMDSQQDKQLDAQRRELNDHFSNYGVVITDISVTNVHLPKEFADTMQEATVWHNRNMFKTLQQEFDLRKIEVRETEAKEKQKLKEELEKFTAEKDKDVADLRKKKKNVDAETEKQLSIIRETQAADVLDIKSKGDLVVAKLNSERDIRLSQLKSAGQAEADKIRVETDTHLATKGADADAEIAKNSAISLKLRAGAEAFSAKQLVAKRKYEAKMRSLQSLRALANNNSLAITGNSKDNIMAQLLANQQGGAVLGINAQ